MGRARSAARKLLNCQVAAHTIKQPAGWAIAPQRIIQGKRRVATADPKATGCGAAVDL